MSNANDTQSMAAKRIDREQEYSRRLLFIVDLDQSEDSVRVFRDGLFRVQELSRTRHKVSLACLYQDSGERVLLDRFVDSGDLQGVEIHWLAKDSSELAPAVISQACLNSYVVYQWLKRNGEAYDIVHAFDADNCLYFSMLSKKLGLHFAELAFLVISNAPLLLIHDLNHRPLDSFVDFAGIFLQRQSLEMADYVFLGSDDLLQWHVQQGHDSLPGKCRVIAPLVAEVFCAAAPAKTVGGTRYFTVLGDLQSRSVLLFYLDSFKRLIRAADAGEIDLTGVVFRFVDHQPLKKLQLRQIKDTFRPGNYRWEVICSDLFEYTRLTGTSENCFLLPHNRLGPGLLEICLLSQQAAFIGFRNAGLETLLQAASIERLVRAHPHDLSKAMITFLNGDGGHLESDHSNAESLSDYDRWYQEFTPVKAGRAEVEPGAALISVCVAHYNRPADLARALDSISRQDYRDIEVIVVDDGSTLPEAIEYLDKLERTGFTFPLKVLRQPNLYIGASRNLAANHAEGKYLLFMDDDNLAKPHELTMLFQVAEHTNADILTCFADAFVNNSDVDKNSATNRIVYSGGDVASGMFRNPYGDSNCLVRRSSYHEIGGFSEDYRIGRDDQEFFSRAVLRGFRLEVVPEALYWYRINTTRIRQNHVSQYAGMHRVVKTYCSESGLAPHWLDVMRYAQGLAAARYGVSARGVRRIVQDNRLRLLAYRYPQLFKWLRPLLRKLL